MDTPPTARRRRFTKAFKAEIVEACVQQGASVASIACAHGINANQVRRWMREHGVGRTLRNDHLAHSLHAPWPAGQFLPVRVENPPSEASRIQIEVRRANTLIKLSWPTASAATCGNWLKDWLR
jgi:transposase-like protein